MGIFIADLHLVCLLDMVCVFLLCNALASGERIKSKARHRFFVECVYALFNSLVSIVRLSEMQGGRKTAMLCGQREELQVYPS